MTSPRRLIRAWRRCPRPRRWVIAAELACFVGEICGAIVDESERRVPAYAQIKRILRHLEAAREASLGDDDGRVERIMARVDAERQSGYLQAHMADAERLATGRSHANGNGHHGGDHHDA